MASASRGSGLRRYAATAQQGAEDERRLADRIEAWRLMITFAGESASTAAAPPAASRLPKERQGHGEDQRDIDHAAKNSRRQPHRASSSGSTCSAPAIRYMPNGR